MWLDAPRRKSAENTDAERRATLKSAENTDAERRATLKSAENMDGKQRLQTIINETLADMGREPVPTIERNMLLRKDLGFDSLELAVLTVKLEAEFGVDVFASGLVTTVGQVEDKLRSG